MAIYFSSFNGINPVVIQCNNYNNPIYSMTVAGYVIKIVDNEIPPNLIADYPPWSFSAAGLLPRTLTTDITFQFYLNNEDTATSPVPIQTSVGISIEFNMGTIPVDNLGCYVKYTFPSDIPMGAKSFAAY